MPGLVGVALLMPIQYWLHGAFTATAFLVVGLVMWTSIDLHRTIAGQPVWVLPLLMRAVRWRILRNPGRR